jgi:hypothetical protein
MLFPRICFALTLSDDRLGICQKKLDMTVHFRPHIRAVPAFYRMNGKCGYRSPSLDF